MKNVCTLLLCLAVILNSIESSSQSERRPDGGHSSSSTNQPDGTPLRARSRSPTLRETSPSVLGFKFEDLEYIRLVPHGHPNRIYELRKYAFPPDKPIGLRKKNFVVSPMPAGEQIVLSTSDGDVCAILEKSSDRHTTLRGIFQTVQPRASRVRINMNSGKIECLTEGEIEECPISTRDVVAKNYKVSRMNSQTMGLDSQPNSVVHLRVPPSSTARSSTSVTQPLSNMTESRSLRQTFPTVLGFKYDDLPSIRLVPHNNPNRIFELRIYNFPQYKPIGLKTKNRVLNPIPTGEKLVLSSSTGDVCAIIEKASNEWPNLRPIFTSIFGILERVKINISSGMVEGMSKQEIAECLGTSGKRITDFYRVFRL